MTPKRGLDLSEVKKSLADADDYDVFLWAKNYRKHAGSFKTYTSVHGYTLSHSSHRSRDRAKSFFERFAFGTPTQKMIRLTYGVNLGNMKEVRRVAKEIRALARHNE